MSNSKTKSIGQDNLLRHFKKAYAKKKAGGDALIEIRPKPPRIVKDDKGNPSINAIYADVYFLSPVGEIRVKFTIGKITLGKINPPYKHVAGTQPKYFNIVICGPPLVEDEKTKKFKPQPKKQVRACEILNMVADEIQDVAFPNVKKELLNSNNDTVVKFTNKNVCRQGALLHLFRQTEYEDTKGVKHPVNCLIYRMRLLVNHDGKIGRSYGKDKPMEHIVYDVQRTKQDYCERLAKDKNAKIHSVPMEVPTGETDQDGKPVYEPLTYKNYEKVLTKGSAAKVTAQIVATFSPFGTTVLMEISSIFVDTNLATYTKTGMNEDELMNFDKDDENDVQGDMSEISDDSDEDKEDPKEDKEEDKEEEEPKEEDPKEEEPKEEEPKEAATDEEPEPEPEPKPKKKSSKSGKGTKSSKSKK